MARRNEACRCYTMAFVAKSFELEYKLYYGYCKCKVFAQKTAHSCMQTRSKVFKILKTPNGYSNFW